MNKIIPTEDRIFMAVVGPSSCGKTDLIFKMLQGKTFFPKFDKVILLYREMQPINVTFDQKLGVNLKKFVDLKFTQNIEDWLLIFDDSCEEIFNDKEFVKLATAGRHRNLHVIYIKHNLYQQSRWSRTTDLNTTHIILFKSPRNVQQVDYLGKQLNLVRFLRHCYDLAVNEIYGHLLIDLSPKTSDCSRYGSNITEPGPTVFFIPTDKAEVTEIANEREKILYAEGNGTIVGTRAT